MVNKIQNKFSDTPCVIIIYLAHALHAPCYHHSGLSNLDGLSSQTHGLQPRAAHHLAAPGRDGVGDTCRNAGLTCRVLALTLRIERKKYKRRLVERVGIMQSHIRLILPNNCQHET